MFAVSSLPFLFIRTSSDNPECSSAPIPASSLMRHPVQYIQIISANIGALLLVNIAEGGFNVLLALHLEDLGVSSSGTASIFSISTISYLCFAVLPSYIPQTIHRKYIILAGLAASSAAYALIGPLFIFPGSLASVCIGVFLLGLGYAFVYMPIFPVILRYSVDVLGLRDNSQLSDTLSGNLSTGLITMSLALGMLIGPPMSGMLAQVISKQVIFHLFGLAFLISCLAYSQLSKGHRRHSGTLYFQLPQCAPKLTKI
mmetsp:Transcript_24256/g.43158  ORF Transcript_24256/g.43158 Transcript_24256/m.43158 type:complete len:257 (+) Transcript_24256:525-1295(+)